jgi:hypothetical protein
MEAATRQSRRFAVDPSQVVHETIDGEVILIQLEQGNYYSLSGSGPVIWELLCAGLTSEEILDSLAPNGARVDVERQVDTLIRDLLQEELIVPAGDEPVARSASTPAANGAGKTFSEPKLEKYSDMQDYLLIDPIHDVTETGWPAAKPK